MMLTHHGTHGKLKLFHLEDGGFNHQRDYKSVYVALGIDISGRKDILGLWISENEGAKFWLGNFTEMKNRGVKDILIACSDNLTGMSDAIASVYPKTEHQICIVHQIRNSLKYVSYKDRKQLAADLKLIYTSATEQEAELALENFDKNGVSSIRILLNLGIIIGEFNNILAISEGNS